MGRVLDILGASSSRRSCSRGDPSHRERDASFSRRFEALVGALEEFLAWDGCGYPGLLGGGEDGGREGYRGGSGGGEEGSMSSRLAGWRNELEEEQGRESSLLSRYLAIDLTTLMKHTGWKKGERWVEEKEVGWN